MTWIDYCPMCGCTDCLYLEFDGTYPEGIIVCGVCDADYCGLHGTEHSTPARAYLTPYYQEPKKEVKTEPVKKDEKPNHWEIVRNNIHKPIWGN